MGELERRADTKTCPETCHFPANEQKKRKLIFLDQLFHDRSAKSGGVVVLVLTKNRNLLLSPFPAFFAAPPPLPRPNQMHAFPFLPPPPFHLNYSAPFFLLVRMALRGKKRKGIVPTFESNSKWWKLCNEDDSSFYFPPLVARQFFSKAGVRRAGKKGEG